MAEIEFGTFTPEVKENPYGEAIKSLAEQNDPNAAITLRVDVNEASREQNLVQKAANAVGKTARLRHKDESKVTTKGEGDDAVKSGTVALTFTLTEKHKARRGAK